MSNSQSTQAFGHIYEHRKLDVRAAHLFSSFMALGASVWLGPVAAFAWWMLIQVLLRVDLRVYAWAQAQEAGSNGVRGLLYGWAILMSGTFNILSAALLYTQSPAASVLAALVIVGALLRNSPALRHDLGLGLCATVPALLVGIAGPMLHLLEGAGIRESSATIISVLSLASLLYGGWLARSFDERRLEQALVRVQAQAAETERQRRLASLLFEQSTISATLFDKDLRLLIGSRTWLDAFNLETSNFIGRPLAEVLPWAPPHWHEAFRDALLGHGTARESDAIMTPEGLVHLKWEINPWWQADGEISGVVFYAEDVTALSLSKAAADATASRLAMALDAAQAGIWEIDLCKKRVINGESVAHIYGFVPTLDAMHPNHMPGLNQDERVQLSAIWDRAMNGTFEDGGQELEHRVVRPDGSDGWVHCAIRPVYTGEGVVSRLVIMTTDITKRKLRDIAFYEAMVRAERSLESKRQLLLDIGNEIGGDAAQLANAMGKPITDQLAPKTNINMDEMFTRLRRLLGEIYLRDAALEEAVDHLRRSRVEAEAANIAKSHFLANMSHELRTPLNAIIGYGEILLEDAQDRSDDTAEEDVGRVLLAARRLLTLINDILDLSKIEAGRMDVMAADFSVPQLVSEVISTVRPSSENNKNTLTFDIAEGIVAAHNDGFKISQCLINLLSNAVKFTKAGNVSLTVTHSSDIGGDWLHFAVRDQGIGISPEQLDRLFQPFVQADGSTTREFGGTGLGLVITRRLARLMGGDVVVTSELGVGSCFTLTIPTPFRKAEAMDEPVLDLDIADAPLVLVIDDDPNVRDLIRRTLVRGGYAVRATGSGREGLRWIQDINPSAVVLDLDLPDMNGFEVLKAVKADPNSVNVPVIVHTVNENRADTIGLGAVEHICKPCSGEIVLAAVMRFVAADPQALRSTAA